MLMESLKKLNVKLEHDIKNLQMVLHFKNDLICDLANCLRNTIVGHASPLFRSTEKDKALKLLALQEVASAFRDKKKFEEGGQMNDI